MLRSDDCRRSAVLLSGRGEIVQSIPSAGEVVGGKYRVLGLLGQGGMGAVLEAEHQITRKRVALKWMHPQIAGDADAQARFVREAQASARVRHPNIVDVYDVVREGDALFLVMELLEGETLTALLRRGGTPIHKLIELLLPALRAVAAAHRQGVIHRDLKPDNIFLTRQQDSPLPVPKVLDFGISKVADSSALTLTRTGAAMGTPMYMSLEQLCGDKDLDARADVYALGVILYEAVTGRAPFEAATFSELAIKVATVEPPGPKQVRPELPSALGSLIGAAMAKKRENRLSSVDELVQKLEPFATEQSFRAKMTHASNPIPAVRGESNPPPAQAATPLPSARPVEASPTYAKSRATDRPKPAESKSRLPLIAFAAAALLCVVGLGATLARRLSEAPPAGPGAEIQQPGAQALPVAAEPERKGPAEAQVMPNADAHDAAVDAPVPKKPAAPPPKNQPSAKGPDSPGTREPGDLPMHAEGKARPSLDSRAGPMERREFVH
jgi:serine/threonine-protein kinase